MDKKGVHFYYTPKHLKSFFEMHIDVGEAFDPNSVFYR